MYVKKTFNWQNTLFLLTIRVILKNKMSRFHKVNSSKIKRDSHTHFLSKFETSHFWNTKQQININKNNRIHEHTGILATSKIPWCY